MENAPATSIADLERAAQAGTRNRVLFWYDVPEKLQPLVKTKKVAIVELTAGEEMEAAKRCRTEPIRLAFELVLESLRFVDSKAVSTADGTTEQAWGPMHPKLRALVTAAFHSLHSPEKEDAAAFLKSQKASAGASA